MPPMIRRRVGTGALYADNAPRRVRSSVHRGTRRSRMARVSTEGRPWSATTGDPIAFDFNTLLKQTQEQIQDILAMFAWVGEVVGFCTRRRERMDAQTKADADQWLEWYLVLYTVGLLDRRGVWLGPDFGKLPER